MEEKELTAQQEAIPENESSTQEVTKEDTVDDKKKKKDDDDEGGSVFGCLFMVVLVGVAIWLLVHFNPSEEDHREKIGEVVTEQLTEAALDGYTLAPSSTIALSRIKYHSAGVCSWTSTRQGGKTVITSIGICGWVCPLI